MITLGKVNKLTLEAAGYEGPDGGSDFYDDFLLIDIEYSVDEKSVFRFCDPCITARELAGLSRVMKDFQASGKKKKVIEFLEPIIKITIGKNYGGFYVTFEIFMESYQDGDSIIKTQQFNEKNYEKFIESIERESEKFPPRF